MSVREFEILSMEDLSKIKGGNWYYDEATDTWYWIEPNILDLDSTENM